MSTEILPVGQPAPESTGSEVAVVETARRRRRGWIIALVVLAIVLLLGFIAFLVADGLVKDYARDYVRTRIIEVLALPDDAKVDVDLGGGSILLQALAGRIASVDATVPEATFGALTGAAELHAEGVPLDPATPVDELRVDFAVAEDDLVAIAGNLSGLELDSIELDEPEIVVASGFSIFGFQFQLGMGLEPSAADGQLVFTPTKVTVGDDTYTTEQVLADPLFGLFARDLLKQQSVCIAGYLPVALVLTSADVDGEHLTLGFSADGAALGGAELSTLGTCPGA
jgi:hypothetical protein